MLIKKVLFLDIDGVLNSAQAAIMFNRLNKLNNKREWRPYKDFCPIAISNLCRILEEDDEVRIVVSSTWRLGCDTLKDLQDIFEPLPSGVKEIIQAKIIDRTPAFHDKERGIEIQSWIDKAKIDTKLDPAFMFVIVDDDGDMAHLRCNLVQTNGHNGLTFVETSKILYNFETTFQKSMREALDGCRKITWTEHNMTNGKEIRQKVEEIRALLSDKNNTSLRE